MGRLSLCCFTLVFFLSMSIAQSQNREVPIHQVFQDKPTDSRLGELKTLNGYFPFQPPKTLGEWQKRRSMLKTQLRVALGLWPGPAREKLSPIIHGKIERDGYTVEKVYFASFPGHYVTGNLYRPKATDKSKKYPGILCPHGHWSKGRFYQNSEAGAQREVKSGAEKTLEGALYPLQARCAMLARLGFVVFHYDMVGYADATALPHVARSGVPHENGIAGLQGELHLLSLMGLQTWNSIRALDFLQTLSDVDPKKLGITGASGGGTQSMILAAVDERVQVAFPAVMVSTGMQGGCPCENCSLLRVNT